MAGSFPRLLNERFGRPTTHFRRYRGIVPSCLAVGILGIGTLFLAPMNIAGATPGSSRPFLSHLKTVTNIASTIPANGDLNPYGIVEVPQTEGSLVRGDTLVSNFNVASNLQGTGSTIVQISPSGQVSLFSQLSGALPGRCPGGIGLTTALTVLVEASWSSGAYR